MANTFRPIQYPQNKSAAAVMEEEKRIEDELKYPIILSDRIRKAVEESVFFKSECSEVGKQVDHLSLMLRNAVRFATSNPSIYDRPIRRISADVSKNLTRALTLLRKCKRRNILHRLLNIVSAADFRKLYGIIDASIGDMRWLLSILDCEGGVGGGVGGGIVLSLPPIASNDPILSWVWSFIATVHMGLLTDRIEAANELASLAQDNDRNKKIIVEEGGIPPLLRLLKENASADAQIAAANALHNLANDAERVRLIVDHHGVPSIVQVLNDSCMKSQISVANLVAVMAEHDHIAREEFARENVIRPLVSLLSFETFEDDDHMFQLGKQSIHSIVQISKESEKHGVKKHRPRLASSFSMFTDGSRGGNYRKERENESPETKRRLKISCAKALCMLATDSALNSRRITETKGMLCLAKLIEKEEGELQRNCLMTVTAIASAAESNADLRRSAFKTNSPAAKAIIQQLLWIIKESNDSSLRIPAIRSIGSLARTFPVRENGVIHPLVHQLSHQDQEVAAEAVIALSKFAGPDNYLCGEHCKSIVEFDGILPIMRLLRGDDRIQFQALCLLCYLAIHAGNHEALEQARVLTALEGTDKMLGAQHPMLRELIAKAIYHLRMYSAGIDAQGNRYVV